jgi:L-threonylcarbamoyladenylate synthase
MTDGKIVSIAAESETGPLFAKAIKEKKIVVFPWETVYCLCFDVLDEDCVERAYQIKGRPKEKKFPSTLPGEDYLEFAGVRPNELESKFMAKYWPGQLTIAFSEDFACNVATNPYHRKMLRRLKTIVATTSANTSGRPGPLKAKDIEKRIVDQVDLVFVDDSKIAFPTTTTVVRLKDGIEVLREGAVNLAEDIHG